MVLITWCVTGKTDIELRRIQRARIQATKRGDAVIEQLQSAGARNLDSLSREQGRLRAKVVACLVVVPI